MGWVLLCLLITSNKIAFTTGGLQGTYQSVASSIDSAVTVEYPEINFEMLFSDGSMQNLERLYNGTADFGIVQSNDLHYAALHHRKYPFLKNRITAVTALYEEPLHIIVRKDQKILDPIALSGRRISMGPEGSGTYFVAQAVLITAGIMNSVNYKTMTVNEFVAALRNFEIDAAFFVSSPYVRSSVSELMNNDNRFEIIGLGSDMLQGVRKDHPYLKQMTIPANAYRGTAKTVYTVGAQAVLVCRSELPADLVESVTRSIFKNKRKFADHVRQQLDIDFAAKHLPVELHMGANSYYIESSILRRHYAKLQMALFLCVIFALTAALYSTKKPKINNLVYIRLVRVLIFFLIVWVTGAYIMYSFERSINEHFGSISESFWSIATYLLSGLEDMNPITIAGRTVAFIILAIGIGTIAFITAEVASIFTQNKMRKDYNMQGFKEHVVLCNWSSRGERILKEFYNPISPMKNTSVGVITDKPDRFMGISDKFGNRVHLIVGDPNRTTTLKKAEVAQASAIIILANEDEKDPDGASAQILLALTRLLDNCEIKGPRPKLMVEVMDSRYRETLGDAGADIMICGEDFSIGTLAQSAIFPGLTKIYEELLDYGSDNNEFYVLRVNKFDKKLSHSEIIGKSFLEVAERIALSRNQTNPALLVGVKKGSQVILNPKEKDILSARSFNSFKADDSLILLAYRKPEYNEIFNKGTISFSAGSSKDSEIQYYDHEINTSLSCVDEGERQILICNWSPVGEKIIEELHDVSSPARNMNIIVLSENLVDDRAYTKKHAFKENVTFLSGRTTNKNVLKMIGAHRSKSIIVLANDNVIDADGSNTLTVLSLKRLFNEELNGNDFVPNIIIEAINHRKQESLIGAGASEIISREDFTMGILAQSCMYPQISEVFNELLDYDDDSNEIYISHWAKMPIKVRKRILGKSFVDIYGYFLKNRSPLNPAMLIGIFREGEFIINPRDIDEERFKNFAEGDGLIFLSYKTPEL